MRVRVVDLDGSLVGQAPLHALCEQGKAILVEARDLGPSLRIVASQRAMRLLVRRLDSVLAAASADPAVTFYGSGDFHHLTAALLSGIEEPVTVVHFDNHPDWVSFPSTFNCGAWVNRALELPNVIRVVTIGPCSGDLVRPELQMANLRAIAKGRLLLYPWRHAPSRVWGRYGKGDGHEQRDGFIYWRNLAKEDWGEFLDELVDRLPTDAICITIDKDVLRHTEAVTNWDQGEMTLGHLLEAITKLAAHRRVMSVDVCGDYSRPVFRDAMRALLAHFDHPAGVNPSQTELTVNAHTNAALFACLQKVLQ